MATDSGVCDIVPKVWHFATTETRLRKKQNFSGQWSVICDQ